MSTPGRGSSSLRVTRIEWLAQGVLAFELRPLDPLLLPPFEAGAHVDIELPGGLLRSYSLCNDPAERHRYVVAVGLDAASRGGSRYLHESLRAGTVLPVDAPRNNFRLHEEAARNVFVAGGIGITPIWSMVQRLVRSGRPWQLLYAARSRRNAAFVAELEAAAAASGAALQLHFDDEQSGVPDLGAYLAAAGADSHAYCCGPVPMLGAFEEAAARHLPAEQIHLEYFKAKEPVSLQGAFRVDLVKSRKSLEVPAGKSILDVLLDAGIEVSYSCMDGICGSCEVHVLAGIPDHRDLVLSEAQKAANDTMMVCCSRSRSETLVLDI